MPDKKLTDKEIVKALECCSTASCISNKCHYEKIHDIPTCTTKLTKNALDLINRLQAENERLCAEVDELIISKDLLFDEAEALIKKAKAEAYKEFAELLCEIWQRYEEENISGIYVPKWVMRVYEELVGEQPTPNNVKCIDCEYLELELPYAVCSKAYKGIVQPNDSCGKGKLKEMGCE